MQPFIAKPKVNIANGLLRTGGFGRFQEAEGTTALSGGTLYAVTLTSQGDGYISTSDATVTFTAAPSGGTNAEGACVLGNGRVVSVPITTAGRGYVTNPAVTFSAGGGAGYGLLGPDGSVVAIIITKRGSGLTSVPTATIAAAPSGGTNAVLGTVVCAFTITSVTITEAGAGYLTAPIPTFGTPLQAVVAIPGLSAIDYISGLYVVGVRASGEIIQWTSPNIGQNLNVVSSPLPMGIPDAPNGSIILTRSGGSYTTNLGFSVTIEGH